MLRKPVTYGSNELNQLFIIIPSSHLRSQEVFLLLTDCINMQSVTAVTGRHREIARGQQLVIEKNLQMVAARYDIQIAEAQLKQARQWRNPLFAWNADLYSLELNQFFNYRNQKLIQIEQVITISGKHRNEVRLARMNVDFAKLQVNDVLRGLLYECAIQYTELQTLQEQEALFEMSISRLEEVLKFAEEGK